jgi:hypothetical protein
MAAIQGHGRDRGRDRYEDEDIVRRLQSMSAGDLGERSVVTGDAERCNAHLKRVEPAGIAEVILNCNVGLYPHVETMAMMERCAREVLRAFAGT